MYSFKRVLLSCFTAILLVAGAGMMTGCQGKDSQGSESNQGKEPSDESNKGGVTDKNEYEFEFVGTGTDAEGKELTIKIVGNKDSEQTISAESEDIPTLLLEGTWELVENKGYKISIDDGWNYPVVYTKYDTEKKEFSFDLSLSMVDYTFVYQDEAFASVYDGEGLKALPTFACTGWCHDNTLLPATLRLYEDGTCRVQSDYSVPIMEMGRTGKWSYDETDNKYIFDFDEDQWEHCLTYEEDGVVSYRHYLGPNDEYEHWPTAEGAKEFKPAHVESVYDESVGTYTIEFSAICCSVVDWTGVYTVE